MACCLVKGGVSHISLSLYLKDTIYKALEK